MLPLWQREFIIFGFTAVSWTLGAIAYVGARKIQSFYVWWYDSLDGLRPMVRFCAWGATPDSDFFLFQLRVGAIFFFFSVGALPLAAFFLTLGRGHESPSTIVALASRSPVRRRTIVSNPQPPWVRHDDSDCWRRST